MLEIHYNIPKSQSTSLLKAGSTLLEGDHIHAYIVSYKIVTMCEKPKSTTVQHCSYVSCFIEIVYTSVLSTNEETHSFSVASTGKLGAAFALPGKHIQSSLIPTHSSSCQTSNVAAEIHRKFC